MLLSRINLTIVTNVKVCHFEQSKWMPHDWRPFLYLLCFYSTPHACLSRNINITCSVLSTHFHSLCPKSLKVYLERKNIGHPPNAEVNHRCYRHHHTSQIRKKVKKRTCFLLFLNSTVPLVSVFRKWELYVCSGLCILSALGISFVTTARHRKRRVDGFSLWSNKGCLNALEILLNCLN